MLREEYVRKKKSFAKPAVFLEHFKAKCKLLDKNTTQNDKIRMAYRFSKDLYARLTAKHNYTTTYTNGRYMTESAENSLVEYHDKIIKTKSLGNEETYFKVKVVRLYEKL